MKPTAHAELMILYKAAKYGDAVALLLKELNIDSKDTEVLYHLGYSYRMNGDHLNSFLYFERSGYLKYLLKNKVMLKQYLDLIQEKYVNEMGMKLPVFFGLDVNRHPIIKDITQTGNIIIAGATNSGKSMFMHTVLNTFMYLYSPETIKFVLVDPKLVELQQYETSPYLFSKVLTTSDAEEYFIQLENLYSNKQLGKNNILVCIDPFCDLMYVDTKRFETIISKLSTLDNIYLIMADSRPAPNVFTPGIMKLFPTKILMRTASVKDSMVFSGSTYGCSLLGKGDSIIYFPTEKYPINVQCPYIDDADCGRLSNNHDV